MKRLTRKMASAVLLLVVFCCSALPAQALDLKGTVLDEKDNEPLIGASVRVKNKAQGAATDIDGKFSIAGVDPKSHNHCKLCRIPNQGNPPERQIGYHSPS